MSSEMFLKDCALVFTLDAGDLLLGLLLLCVLLLCVLLLSSRCPDDWENPTSLLAAAEADDGRAEGLGGGGRLL